MFIQKYNHGIIKSSFFCPSQYLG